jgi:hypothetical protein
MDDTDIFDEFVKLTGVGERYTRVLPPGSQPEIAYRTMRKWAADLIQDPCRFLPGFPHIHFDFVRSGIPNAWAFRHRARYFIAMTTGIPYLLQLVLFRMLADRRVLPSIGEPQLEEADLPVLTGYAPHAQDMAEAGLFAPLPKCPARLEYAKHLRQVATMFFVSHELAHIARGHIGYGSAKTATYMIDERSQLSGASRDVFESQVFEMDADKRATLFGIWSIRSTHETHGQLIPPWSTVPETPANLLFLWSLAVNTLFRLLGDGAFTTADLATDDHPPLATRRSMIMQAALAFVDVWQKDLHDGALSALRLGMEETDRSFEIILGGTTTRSGIPEAFSPQMQEYYHSLQNCWFNELAPRVEPYAFEKLGFRLGTEQG